MVGNEQGRDRAPTRERDRVRYVVNLINNPTAHGGTEPLYEDHSNMAHE